MQRTITKKKKFFLPGGEFFEFRDDSSCGKDVLFGVESDSHAVYAKFERFRCVFVGMIFFLKPFAFETVRLNGFKERASLPMKLGGGVLWVCACVVGVGVHFRSPVPVPLRGAAAFVPLLHLPRRGRSRPLCACSSSPHLAGASASALRGCVCPPCATSSLACPPPSLLPSAAPLSFRSRSLPPAQAYAPRALLAPALLPPALCQRRGGGGVPCLSSFMLKGNLSLLNRSCDRFQTRTVSKSKLIPTNTHGGPHGDC